MKIEKRSQTRLVALKETARKESQCARKHKKNDNKYVGERRCKIAGHLSLENDKGFKHFLQTLTGGRITISALALGICQAAYNIALKYSHERKAFGKKINKFQSVSFKLADMATQIEAAKHLVYYAAWRKDINKNFIKEAAMAKLFSSELAMKITTEAIQIFGGYGYIKEYDVERFFRDAKILEIGEGTSEVQRIIIAREILKNLN